ncbi:hypothetical protein PQX77_015998 [Marasmius sp. AFHP31]|nr:hypothetical protein PQX77_015998 [Marasmius sp. AFHP31]
MPSQELDEDDRKFIEQVPTGILMEYRDKAHDIASGLVYLHERRIVHGDLKGLNVLVTPDERACIGDFGLSRVADTHSLHLFASETGQTKGTARWLAPELLRATAPCPASRSSDLYAYACVCYEIFVGRFPFYELAEAAVITAVLIDKKHPTRPTGPSELTDMMWEMMMSCWKHDIHLRPTAQEVLSLIGSVPNRQTGPCVQSHATPEWDPSPQVQVWKNVQCPLIDMTTIACLLDPSQPARTTIRRQQRSPPKADYTTNDEEDSSLSSVEGDPYSLHQLAENPTHSPASIVTQSVDEEMDIDPTEMVCRTYRPRPLRLQHYRSSKQRWFSRPKDPRAMRKNPARSIALATWNVDSASPYPKERMRAAIDELKDKILPIDEQTEALKTCVVLLQNVQSSMLEVLKSSLWVRGNFYVTPLNDAKWPYPHTHGNVTLVHRSLQVERVFLLEYRTSPGAQSAIMIDVRLHSDRVLRIINAYLESIPEGVGLRKEQLETCVGYCQEEGIDGAVIAGDLHALDWTSKEQVTVESFGMHDAFQLDPLERPEAGHTWGYQCSNEQDKQSPKGRLDKIIYTPYQGFFVTKPRVVGKGSRDVEGRFISDHYGLIAEICIGDD